MADKHSLNYDVRELKLGSSFTNNKTSQYHTIKYDFKPASVDVNKMATVDVGTNNQVTVTVPHLDGAGVPQTVFKGSQRPYTKECVIIIDKVTGEITIEKLSSNIQVKKTRQETAQKPRPLTPVIADFTNTTQRSSSRTRVATNRRTNNTNASSGQPNSQSRFNNNAPKPQNMVRSPSRVKTSPPQAPWSAGGNSTLASLPMIGLDDAPASSPGAPRAHPAPAPLASHAAHPPSAPHAPHAPPAHMPHVPHAGHAPHVQHTHAPTPAPTLPPSSAASQDDSSSSSSSDSDSDSGSGSDSDDSSARPAHPAHPAHAAHPTHPAPPPANGTAGIPALPSVLNDDLCLSESGSDSD